MSEFVFPFEYLPISKALPIINRHTQSLEITRDLILVVASIREGANKSKM